MMFNHTVFDSEFQAYLEYNQMIGKSVIKRDSYDPLVVLLKVCSKDSTLVKTG